MRDKSDSELMRRVKAGEAACLGELFRRHQARFHAFFLKACGRRDQSEDLLQDCFLRLLRYGASYQDGMPFLPWAFRIARNLLADQRRRQGGEPSADSLDAERLAADSHDPAYLGELGEAERRLQQGLLRLTPEECELILLSKLRELSVPELAMLFECSEAALKVRVHRALGRLRAACETASPCEL